MGISFEQMRDSYSMAKSGCKFFDGMTEIHPEDIVKRLDRLSKLEQTPAFSNVIGQSEIKPANKIKAIKIETTCLEDGLILEECKYQDGVRIGSGACSMCKNYMKGSSMNFSNDTYITICSKYTIEQAKSQDLNYIVV